MLGGHRDVALLVRECRLDDQVAQVRGLVHGLPEAVVRGRVAGIGEARPAAVQKIPHRGHRVVGRKGGDPPAAQFHRLADLDFAVAHEWGVAVGNLGEIRPYLPVEKVGAQDVQRVLDAVDHDRAAPHPAHGIDEKRDAGHVVQVRMAHEDVVDLREPLQGQVAHAGTGIHEDVVVDQERGGPQAPADAAAAPQNPDPHLLTSARGHGLVSGPRAAAPAGPGARDSRAIIGENVGAGCAGSHIRHVGKCAAARAPAPAASSQGLKKNSIFTPAISIMSWSASGWAWAPSDDPLSVG